MATTGNGEGFAKLPNWIARTGYLDPFEYLIYAYLLGRAGLDGKCYPSLRRVANETGISLTKVRRTLDRLEERGIVSRSVKREPEGHYANTRFTVRRFELERPEYLRGVSQQTPPPEAPGYDSTDTTCSAPQAPPVVFHETRKKIQTSRSKQVDPLMEVVSSTRRDNEGMPKPQRATPTQLRYLHDLTILAGDDPPTELDRWREHLTSAEASARITDYERSAGRGIDYAGPVIGDPAFELLSEQGKAFAEVEMIPNDYS